MKYTEWNGGHYDYAAAEELCKDGYPYLVAAVLASRGIDTEQADTLLLREGLPLHDPMLMKDMDKAVERITLALRRHEKIAVFGDYDVDGITATVLLVHYLRSLGADCTKFIPRRIEDGYGLGNDALQSLREQGVSLVITVDCGITGVEEAQFAREIGLDLVITDHHECKDILPDAIAVREVKEAGDRFHARYNAIGKTYRYTCFVGDVKPVFDRRYVTMLDYKVDVEKMRQAAAILTGEHDFRSFCGNPRMKKSTVRMVDSITIEQTKDRIHFTFHGTGFLQNMVRILVGTMLEVGRGYWEVDYVQTVLDAKDRKLAGPTAPPEGLCLMKVDY